MSLLAVSNYHAETKAAFRRRVSRLYKGVIQVTPTASTTTTLTIAALADYFPAASSMGGCSIYELALKEWRRVSDWNPTTGVVTVGRAYTSAPGTSDVVDVYRRFNPHDIDDAIQQACTASYPDIAVTVVDESIVIGDDPLTTNTTADKKWYTYVLPSTIRDLNPLMGGKVSYEINTADATHPYAPVTHWDVRMSLGVQTLQLFGRYPTGRKLRLEGRGILPYPSQDNDLILLPLDTLQLLAYKTAAILFGTQPINASEDNALDLAFEQRFTSMYEANKDRWGTVVPSAYLQNLSMSNALRSHDLAEFSSFPT